MRSKYLLLLTIISLSNGIFAQESLLWLTPKSAPTNFNNNQYECPLWKDTNGLVDLELLKGNSEWIDLQSIIVRDIDGDGFCDIFVSFFSNEIESIPFLLFLYNSASGSFEDSSNLISNNIGQPFNRKTVSADFNADGVLDFVAASHPEQIDAEFSHLDVVISNDTGWKQETLYSPNRSNQEGYFHGVSVGDVDNDGDIDIVVANFHDPEGQFTLLNDGQANFERVYSIRNSKLIGEKEAFTNELFDIDSDGCLDLIYAAVNNLGSIAKIAYGSCDGYDDIIQPKFFEGNWNNNSYPLNWVLFGNEDGLYTYANYPIATPLREISANFIGRELNFNFETDLLSNINAHWSGLDMDKPLRGNISEWIIYYSDSTFSDKNSDRIRRVSILNQHFALSTPYKYGREVAVLSSKFIPRTASTAPLFMRLSYIDEFGVESPLSEEILVEQATSNDGNFSGTETTPAFHTFAPSPLLNLDYNNIGVFDSQKGKIFSCMNILTNGVRSTINYSITITIDAGLTNITDSALFNPNSLKNQNGKLPSCSGTYEMLSQIYADTIQVGTETYRAEFEITNLNTFEMKLIEAIRIGLSAEI